MNYQANKAFVPVILMMMMIIIKIDLLGVNNPGFVRLTLQ